VQGPVVCPSIRAKQVAVCSIPMIGAVKMNDRRIRSEFWGLSGVKAKPGFLSCRINTAKCKTVHCSFNSPSNDSGSTAGNFNENDEDYVTSSVIEAGMFDLRPFLSISVNCLITFYFIPINTFLGLIFILIM